MMSRILYVIANADYFCSHYLALAKAARQAGYVVAVALMQNPSSEMRQCIQEEGISLFSLATGKRVSSLDFIRKLRRIHRLFKPVIIHHISLKISFLGYFAFGKHPITINTLGGLGYIFTMHQNLSWHEKQFKKMLQRVVRIWLMLTKHRAHFIVQNREDKNFIAHFCAHVHLIPGAGVSLTDFPVAAFPAESPIQIVCLARLIKEKGILEFVHAARLIKTLLHHFAVEFILYGLPDPHNPRSFTQQDIQQWTDAIQWQGFCHDVAKAYHAAHIVVLPSYREGMPKSLLEAASCGRPIVTTDTIGCRDVVIDGYNGRLVPVGDVHALASAITMLIEDENTRKSMGQASRAHAEMHFADTIIFQKVLSLYAQLLNRNNASP